MEDGEEMFRDLKEDVCVNEQKIIRIMDRSCPALQLINEMRAGLLREEFCVSYQPQMDISTGTIIGMEALVRWQHPKRGLVRAEEFISLAEQIGLIVKLDEWVLAAVCKQLQQWREMGYPPVRVAVNLSMRTLKKNKVVETITRILRETGNNADQLEIEITESWMMTHPDAAIQEMARLRDMGISLALDDFGAGYSSLKYLKKLPVDVLKIDQSFIRNILTDGHDQKIVRTIIELAHHFKLKVVAEGVETPEQLKSLSETSCDYVQGYLINRPLPASDVEKYFTSGTQHFHLS